MCVKSKKMFWTKSPVVSGDTFPCAEESDVLPSKIVGFTADFAISADLSFTLYVDGNVVGSSDDGKKGISRLTASLYSGSVIALEVLNKRGAPAIKLRYNIDGALHTIDDTWKVSNTKASGFQMPGFNDAKWANPRDMPISEPSFDKTVNWKGLDNRAKANELYIRRTVPDLGATA